MGSGEKDIFSKAFTLPIQYLPKKVKLKIQETQSYHQLEQPMNGTIII